MERKRKLERRRRKGAIDPKTVNPPHSRLEKGKLRPDIKKGPDFSSGPHLVKLSETASENQPFFLKSR
ncbi:MAG: hypothetical protein IT362_10480 [Deltaproteobacteria bacterium]|nr:hypothetical protein [Deltaproteobacteria bacterium]